MINYYANGNYTNYALLSHTTLKEQSERSADI